MRATVEAFLSLNRLIILLGTSSVGTPAQLSRLLRTRQHTRRMERLQKLHLLLK